MSDDVRELDPNDIVEGCIGITLIDDDGKRVRDLIGVPTTCIQLGEPLNVDLEDIDDDE